MAEKSNVDVLGDLLLKHNLTIGTAESCTAGGIAAAIASKDRASAYLRGGIISYATDIKESVLGVSPNTIKEHDVVSEEVAIEMAMGAVKVLNTDIAISITGYAGSTGGNDKVPNGTIWICALNNKTGDKLTRKVVYHEGRYLNLIHAKNNAINLGIDLLNRIK